MPTTVICIGDPHVQVTNIQEIDLFMDRVEKLAKTKTPDFIVILGDVLHTHERLHTLALNKAYELVHRMRMIAKTYVLVGNHDYCNNQQFLTENHWLGGMKEWDNVVIVDKVLDYNYGSENFFFVPYVPPGRFIDALNTSSSDWKTATCIFAHQEFAGCKMGAIISIEGDKWPEDYTDIISGHIHSKQMPQKNIYYTGSAMQHAFGESEKNIIAFLTFTNKTYMKEEIDLELPRKKIIYMDVEKIDTYNIPTSDDSIKLTISGNHDKFKALKKTKKYKELIDSGIKVVFKPEKKIIDTVTTPTEEIQTSSMNFENILQTIINQKKDVFLLQAYELILNDKKISTDDIIFL